MLDLLFVAMTIVFFVLAVAYVAACERLEQGRPDQPPPKASAVRRSFSEGGRPALRGLG